ncbi:MAG TPA: tRNA (adenosine(37)-N6)-threonylcarbamoyltransferase complex dimerization subunit type 1 TsaB [Desulfobacteraceae bacterium]|nr:tRNA (adenosine(37)-N6)-threonylcarbamoyltransferase complex dimerization subunit type 1 TsaB [Deltaproteobacteria bacterium]MBW2356791.1 tRNA (adenosine(37)-N6)-threonylcarbamoyltransferase complex dimerization subunit type 1 TsaB [Deltaproteobacteria bacterium]HDI59533.1 tRNA (adenosine(37)-N6)-threonylcarbamoyltransferase complex dimerization subunit type 1 TsaB [Desulfobacteraceae bacterium]
MKVLALDTATGPCTVGLLDDAELVAEGASSAVNGPVRRLMPLVVEVLAQAGLKLSQVDLMAVTRGPGSFTGLRVGMATVQGLALATGIPVVAVSSLEALALQAADDAVVAPLIDARRGEVYSAVYKVEAGKPTVLAPEAALTPQAAAGRIQGPCILIGSGVEVHRETLEAALAERATLAPPALNALRAASVGRLALQRIGEAGPAVELVPRYLRAADAKPRVRGGRRVGIDKSQPDC